MKTFSAITLWTAMLAGTALAQEPRFTKDNRLIKPADYREWVYVSSGLGMTYGPSHGVDNHPRFDNVFVNPRAYKAFMQTGTWPDGTIFVLEVRDSASEGSINHGGHYQGSISHISAEVKDSSRFADKWGYFPVDVSSSQPTKELPQSAGCQACHGKNGAVENTFVQFYPTLAPVAKAKGTFKEK